MLFWSLKNISATCHFFEFDLIPDWDSPNRRSREGVTYFFFSLHQSYWFLRVTFIPLGRNTKQRNDSQRFRHGFKAESTVHVVFLACYWDISWVLTWFHRVARWRQLAYINGMWVNYESLACASTKTTGLTSINSLDQIILSEREPVSQWNRRNVSGLKNICVTFCNLVPIALATYRVHAS